jgi:hypothetical protein
VPGKSAFGFVLARHGQKLVDVAREIAEAWPVAEQLLPESAQGRERALAKI